MIQNIVVTLTKEWGIEDDKTEENRSYRDCGGIN